VACPPGWNANSGVLLDIIICGSEERGMVGMVGKNVPCATQTMQINIE
jgi:hypothetical protein